MKNIWLDYHQFPIGTKVKVVYEGSPLGVIIEKSSTAIKTTSADYQNTALFLVEFFDIKHKIWYSSSCLEKA